MQVVTRLSSTDICQKTVASSRLVCLRSFVRFAFGTWTSRHRRQEREADVSMTICSLLFRFLLVPNGHTYFPTSPGRDPEVVTCSENGKS
jgi:hypothetical protein